MLLVHVKEDVIGYLQERSLGTMMYTISRLCPGEDIM